MQRPGSGGGHWVALSTKPVCQRPGLQRLPRGEGPLEVDSLEVGPAQAQPPS